MQRYDLHYSAGTKRTGRELMIFSASLAQKILNYLKKLFVGLFYFLTK